MTIGDDDDPVWRALADPTRRAIVDFVAVRGRTTGDVVAHVDHLCRTAVMKHLDVLETAGLIVVRREGRTRWNYLNPVPIQRIHDRWVHPHVSRVASSLLRLKDAVETDADTPARREPTCSPHSNPRRSRATSSKSSSKPRGPRSGTR